MAEALDRRGGLIGASGDGEVVEPVEASSSSPKAECKISQQCSEEDDKGKAVFFTGGEHSYSLDSGLKNLGIDEKIEALRKEFDGKIQHLENNLEAKTQELDARTKENEELAKRLETEKKEKKEKVEKLEEEKRKLETKIEQLENEVKSLKDELHTELSRYMNQSKGLEEQIQKIHEKEKIPASEVPMSQLFADMCKLFQRHGVVPTSLQHAIQKSSIEKEAFKIGSTPVVQPSEHADPVEQNNNLRQEDDDAASRQQDSLVESNNTSLS